MKCRKYTASRILAAVAVWIGAASMGAHAQDLVPYQPGNWNNGIPLGVTQLSGADTHSYNGPYYDDDTIYFNVSPANAGFFDAFNFFVNVQVLDSMSSVVGNWNYPVVSLPAQTYDYLGTDESIGTLAAGNYTIQVTVDSTGAVFESNEVNNFYQRAFTVQAAAPTVTSKNPTGGATVATSTLDVDVTFSKPVNGVDSSDMVLSGSAAGSASVGTPTHQGSNVWRFPVTGLVNGTLNISLAPDPNDIEDSLGNDLSPRPTQWNYTVSIISIPDYRFKSMWPTLSQPWFFWNPFGIAVDSDGNVYVADTTANFVKKLSPQGILLTQWGGPGTAPGKFNYVQDIALDGEGFVYVADMENHRIQKFTVDGEFVLQWGTEGTGVGQLSRPSGIDIDDYGYVFVLESGNGRVSVFSPDGDFITGWTGLTTWPNPPVAGFEPRGGLAVLGDGTVYIADLSYNVHVFTWYGFYLGGWALPGTPMSIEVDEDRDRVYVGFYEHQVARYTTLGAPYSTWGTGEWGLDEGQFNSATAIGVAPNGDVYVSDLWDRIQRFQVNGTYLSEWTAVGWDQDRFTLPTSVVLGDDVLYVVDAGNNRVQRYTRDGVFLNQWGGNGSQSTGKLAVGSFFWPWVAAVDSTGKLYVTDMRNNRVQKFSATGTVLSVWGATAVGGNGVSPFLYPAGIAVNNSDQFYVMDAGNYKVRKFTSAGTELLSWGSQGSGLGQFGFEFTRNGNGIAVDSTGNVYVVDSFNDRVQKFDSSGNFILQWGSNGTGQGQFDYPGNIMISSTDLVYVSDVFNNRIQVFTTTGQYVDTIGGPGNGPGQILAPGGVAEDENGDLYVVDVQNVRVQRFNSVTLSENPKAIIVSGGGAFVGNELWEATQANTNFAHRAMQFQGYTKDTIYYISSNTNLDLDGNGLADDVDANATNANLEYALRTWAGQQLNGLPTGDVVVYLCDHGGVDTFRMSGTETLNASDLDIWLDELESEITGDLIVIYDACESGTFQQRLKKSGRTVITSTSPGESAYFLSTGTVSFSNFFWTQVFNGEQLSDAYAFAKSAVGQAFDAQTPLVNVDGDGSYDEATGDLNALVGVYIGSGTNYSQGRPTITSVSAPQAINGTSTATLSASGVVDPEGDKIARVWAVVRPPDFVITDSQNPIQDLPSVNLARVGSTNNYTINFDGFTSVGLYQVTLYAMDDNLNVSAPSSTTVAVDSPLERKAIIIAGGKQTDPLWNKTQNVAGQAYEALKAQGYLDQNIAFRSPVTFNAGVDGAPSLANLEYLLKTWGRDDTYDLVLYLVGTGGVGTFRMSPGETLFSDDLDSWLDTLQHPTLGIPGRVSVIIDSDFSGSFVPALKAPTGRERIVIGSSGKTQQAQFLSGGDISFSAYFWNRVLNGATVRSAFKHAQGAMRFNGRGQRASWDDNTNGIPDEKGEGQIALLHRIGMGVQLAGDDPVIGSIVGEAQLNGGTSFTIYVDEVTTTGTIATVTATIYPPDGSTPVQKTLTETPANSGHYQVTHNGFTENGVYAVSVVAKDTDEHVSLPSETTVEQLAGTPPSGDAYENDDTSAAAQNYDTDFGGTQSHTFHDNGDWDWFKFTAGTNDVITIETSNLGTNTDTYLQLYQSNGTTLITTDDDSSPDDYDIYGERYLFKPSDHNQTAGTFYLKVRSSPTAQVSPDYGVNATYDIRIIREIGGCEVPGQLYVKLKDANTNNLVPGATVTITKGATRGPDLAQNGAYVFDDVVNQQYTVSITPPAGYNAFSNKTVTPACGTLTTVTYTLTPSGPPTTPDIEITPSSWQFGPTNPGAVEDKIITIKNVGGGTLNWSASGLAAPFSLIDGGSDFDLTNGQTETITVRYAPSTSQNILNDDTIIISGSDPVDINISGVLAEAELVADGAASLRELVGINSGGCINLTQATNAGLAVAYRNALYPTGSECWTLAQLMEFELGENSQSILYVDFSYNGNMAKEETGLTTDTPFNTLGEAFAYVLDDGTGEIQVRGGTSAETFNGGNVVNPGGRVKVKRRVSGTVIVGAGGAPEMQLDLFKRRWGSDSADNSSSSTDEIGRFTVLSEDEIDALYTFNTAVYEAVFPAQTDESGQHMVQPDGTIAVRLRNYSGLDLQRLWAELKPEYAPDDVAFDWKPATRNYQAKDVWILFDPANVWYLNDLLEVTAGGETLEGVVMASTSFTVAVADLAEEPGVLVPQPEEFVGSGVAVYEVTVPDEEGNPVRAYRIGPDAVFDEPVTVWIPGRAGGGTGVRYHKFEAPNDGWHNAGDVVGFLDAEPVSQNGGYVLTVLHGAVVR